MKGVERFNDLADYLVVNVSSPNTPGLRAMQGRKELQTLLDAVVAQRDQGHKKRTPIVVKIAPDLSQQDKIDIAAVVARPKVCHLTPPSKLTPLFTEWSGRVDYQQHHHQST